MNEPPSRQERQLLETLRERVGGASPRVASRKACGIASLRDATRTLRAQPLVEKRRKEKEVFTYDLGLL